MPEQIENRMVVDSEWEFLETQLRVHKRYKQRNNIFDEYEQEENEDEFVRN